MMLFYRRFLVAFFLVMSAIGLVSAMGNKQNKPSTLVPSNVTSKEDAFKEKLIESIKEIKNKFLTSKIEKLNRIKQKKSKTLINVCIFDILYKRLCRVFVAVASDFGDSFNCYEYQNNLINFENKKIEHYSLSHSGKIGIKTLGCIDSYVTSNSPHFDEKIVFDLLKKKNELSTLWNTILVAIHIAHIKTPCKELTAFINNKKIQKAAKQIDGRYNISLSILFDSSFWKELEKILPQNINDKLHTKLYKKIKNSFNKMALQKEALLKYEKLLKNIHENYDSVLKGYVESYIRIDGIFTEALSMLELNEIGSNRIKMDSLFLAFDLTYIPTIFSKSNDSPKDHKELLHNLKKLLYCMENNNDEQINLKAMTFLEKEETKSSNEKSPIQSKTYGFATKDEFDTFKNICEKKYIGLYYMLFRLLPWQENCNLTVIKEFKIIDTFEIQDIQKQNISEPVQNINNSSNENFFNFEITEKVSNAHNDFFKSDPTEKIESKETQLPFNDAFNFNFNTYNDKIFEKNNNFFDFEPNLSQNTQLQNNEPIFDFSVSKSDTMQNTDSFEITHDETSKKIIVHTKNICILNEKMKPFVTRIISLIKKQLSGTIEKNSFEPHLETIKKQQEKLKNENIKKAQVKKLKKQGKEEPPKNWDNIYTSIQNENKNQKKIEEKSLRIDENKENSIKPKEKKKNLWQIISETNWFSTQKPNNRLVSISLKATCIKKFKDNSSLINVSWKNKNNRTNSMYCVIEGKKSNEKKLENLSQYCGQFFEILK